MELRRSRSSGGYPFHWLYHNTVHTLLSSAKSSWCSIILCKVCACVADNLMNVLIWSLFSFPSGLLRTEPWLYPYPPRDTCGLYSSPCGSLRPPRVDLRWVGTEKLQHWPALDGFTGLMDEVTHLPYSPNTAGNCIVLKFKFSSSFKLPCPCTRVALTFHVDYSFWSFIVSPPLDLPMHILNTEVFGFMVKPEDYMRDWTTLL